TAYAIATSIPRADPASRRKPTQRGKCSVRADRKPCRYQKFHPRWIGQCDGLRVGRDALAQVVRSCAGGALYAHKRITMLRQQLKVLRRQAPSRPRLTAADRLLFVWLPTVSVA